MTDHKTITTFLYVYLIRYTWNLANSIILKLTPMCFKNKLYTVIHAISGSRIDSRSSARLRLFEGQVWRCPSRGHFSNDYSMLLSHNCCLTVLNMILNHELRCLSIFSPRSAWASSGFSVFFFIQNIQDAYLSHIHKYNLHWNVDVSELAMLTWPQMWTCEHDKLCSLIIPGVQIQYDPDQDDAATENE